MKKIKLYNTKNRAKQEFKPIKAGFVGLYTCGPTVYNYAHLGNLRCFLFEDVLKRVLKYNGYQVKHVMNITDVGHLTGDRDMGEDKLEKGARQEGKTAWEVAEFYTQAFLQDIKALNIEIPDELPKVTEYITEQIALIKILEEKAYTYKIGDGIYYDTSKFKDYTKLNHKNLDDLQEGARVEKNIEKKNATDFALWKFSYPKGRDFDPTQDDVQTRRHMEWSSPWGLGFPGWHIECSAMSQALLGDNMDIHCGGQDHIDVHHTNEIAQSEAAYEKEFFNFWLHGAFLNIQGGKKMAKSSGNFLTVQNALLNKNINPLVYRFATLQTHYRKPMEYSEEIIKNAANGYEHLLNQVRDLREQKEGQINQEFKEKFLQKLNDDLNTPQALAVVQEVLKSDLANKEKLATVLNFDQVLGLDLAQALSNEIPTTVLELAKLREQARQNKDFAQADKLRHKIADLGYQVKDNQTGAQLIKS